jgi:hypothetical protein
MRKRLKTQDARLERLRGDVELQDTLFEQALVSNGRLQQRLLDAGVSLLRTREMRNES